jgi:hyperosmotically inducible periplasmic protein
MMMKLYSLLIVPILLASGCNDANRSKDDLSPNGNASMSRDSVQRDNSAVNQRDQLDTAKTPFDQNENQKDISTTADIRKRLVSSKMSVNAQNVKIITQDGRVTLRGPVENAAEKMRIDEIARDVAGEDKVASQLEVLNVSK